MTEKSRELSKRIILTATIIFATCANCMEPPREDPAAVLYRRMEDLSALVKAENDVLKRLGIDDVNAAATIVELMLLQDELRKNSEREHADMLSICRCLSSLTAELKRFH